ncbi:relaxase MobL [Arthrobacter castelli]|uniref:relaxase MobL n=1 Tax=Arthrobacter castelli TaxID=271431 RepID=UPI00040F24F3|nr:relaxase MobL [Arthrobacter castelli]
MGLKQDIVLVNEYSVPTPGGGGSRGGTPGNYIQQYMARDQAVESLAPIQRLRTDNFILRYMARTDAVERAPSTANSAKREMRQAQGEGGLAFGYGSVSLSDEQLKAASADMQHLFDVGKTVMKTVLSFDEDYLKRHRIIDRDFHCSQPGDYRGHVDQMKLRMAVMRGMDRMAAGSGGFDDLRYTATIQVDTEHLHAHIAAVDAGEGQLAKDGTQRGKLTDRHKSRLRRGVDAWLDEKQTVAHLSSAVGYERRNVTTFIKRWAHEKMRDESLPQFMLACLPEDRSLWRAGTNDHRMRKANELATELVTEQLERSDSPMPAAMEKIVDYANQRREAEDLSTEQWQSLVDTGRGRIVERGINGVYRMVAALPEDELTIRTPMLDVMGMDYEQMATLAADRHDAGLDDQGESADMVSFGFRLRNYASRLDHHKRKSGVYRDLTRQWERADDAGVADDDSRPLYDFYWHEQQYQLRLMAKYQHFLPFMGEAGPWYEQHQEVADYGQRLLALKSLRHDGSLQRMKDPDEAERLGREIYDQPGGRLLTEGDAGRSVLDHRISTMRSGYDERLEQLRTDLAATGLILRPAQASAAAVDTAGPAAATGTGTDPGADTDSVADDGLQDLVIEKGAAYDFNEVKALDLHHLGYDFFNDVTVGPSSRQAFVAEANQRHELLLGAMAYLDDSHQSEAIVDLPVDDVAAMTKLTAVLDDNADAHGRSVLPSRFAELRAARSAEEKVDRQAASSLDAGLAVSVRQQVDQAALEAPDLSQYPDADTAGSDRGGQPGDMSMGT